MICPHCGYAMDAFDAECPRCHGKGLPETKPTTVLPPGSPPSVPGAATPPPLPSGIGALPVMDLTEPPHRNTPFYVLAGLAYCGAYFAPWWQLALFEKLVTKGEKGIELLAVVSAAAAIVLMLFDQLQGKKEVPLLPQIRVGLSTACLAFAAGELLYGIFLSNVVHLSFGLPVMAIAACIMVGLDFNQLAEETKLFNRNIAAAALVATLAVSGYRGHEVRQVTSLFTGFANAFGDLGPTPTPKPKPEVTVTLNSSRQLPVLQSVGEFPSTRTPNVGKVYLICNVTVAFKGGGEKFSANGAGMVLTASNKHLYDSQTFFDKFQDVTELSSDLIPGGSATGDVIFEVDAGVQAEKVEYSDEAY